MTELIAVITITLLAVVSPGPDFAMVTRNSLLLSRRAGVLTALGIGLGVLVHVTYTLVGVGLLILQSLWLFNAIKLAGAAYLVYLGVKMLRSRPAGELNATQAVPLSDLAALRTGFLTNALNPKTGIYRQSVPAGGAARHADGCANRLRAFHLGGAHRMVCLAGAVLLGRFHA